MNEETQTGHELNINYCLELFAWTFATLDLNSNAKKTISTKNNSIKA